MYIPKIYDYLNILTDDKEKDFVAINFRNILNYKWKLHLKLIEEKNLRKVAESFYIFLTKPNEVEKYARIMQSVSSDKYVHRYNIEISFWSRIITESH